MALTQSSLSRASALAHAGWFCAAVLLVTACGNDDDGRFEWDTSFDPNGGTNRPVGGGGAVSGGGGGGGTAGGGGTSGSGRFDPADPSTAGCPPAGPRVRYAEVSPAECPSEIIACTGGQIRFDSPCGCGCGSPDALCPAPGDRRVYSVSQNPAVCSTSTWSCLPGEVRYDDACGCGCLRTTTACSFDDLFGVQRSEVGAEVACTALVVCLNEEPERLSLDGLLARFPLLSCDAGVHPVCATGTVASCSGAVGVLDAGWAGDLCASVSSADVRSAGCADAP
jgi:hypothetical protein